VGRKQVPDWAMYKGDLLRRCYEMRKDGGNVLVCKSRRARFRQDAKSVKGTSDR